MPNYIDKEKLIRDLIDKGFYPAIVKNAIEHAPTEDVVPRSEVEKAKQEVARKIFEDFTKHKVCTNEEDYRVLAELKKKYIGE